MGTSVSPCRTLDAEQAWARHRRVARGARAARRVLQRRQRAQYGPVPRRGQTPIPANPNPTSKAPTAQGLTLVHFSAQLEPCLTQENTLHNLNTP
jgi:hypothetical protein